MGEQSAESKRLTERLEAQMTIFRGDAEALGFQPTTAALYGQIESLRTQLNAIQATYDQIQDTANGY